MLTSSLFHFFVVIVFSIVVVAPTRGIRQGSLQDGDPVFAVVIIVIAVVIGRCRRADR